MKDEETIVKIAIECWYYSNIDGGEVIRRILDILNSRDITIDDLVEIDTEYLIELITEEETDFKEDPNQNIILSEFIYKDYNVLFSDMAQDLYTHLKKIIMLRYVFLIHLRKFYVLLLIINWI